jgi:GntR family transcriptional repressor for pyruvate dehydrogenase complex
MKAAHRSDDPTGEADADASLHLLIYKAAHNVVFLHIMRVLSDMLRKGMNGRFARKRPFGQRRF